MGLILTEDPDGENLYLLTVEFSSYEVGMENSNRPETGEFATFSAKLCDGVLTFRNLDVSPGKKTYDPATTRRLHAAR